MWKIAHFSDKKIIEKCPKPSSEKKKTEIRTWKKKNFQSRLDFLVSITNNEESLVKEIFAIEEKSKIISLPENFLFSIKMDFFRFFWSSSFVVKFPKKNLKIFFLSARKFAKSRMKKENFLNRFLITNIGSCLVVSLCASFFWLLVPTESFTFPAFPLSPHFLDFSSLAHKISFFQKNLLLSYIFYRSLK